MVQVDIRDSKTLWCRKVSCLSSLLNSLVGLRNYWLRAGNTTILRRNIIFEVLIVTLLRKKYIYLYICGHTVLWHPNTLNSQGGRGVMLRPRSCVQNTNCLIFLTFDSDAFSLDLIKTFHIPQLAWVAMQTNLCLKWTLN